MRATQVPHNYGLLVASSGVQVDVALVDVEGALLLPLYNVDQLQLNLRAPKMAKHKQWVRVSAAHTRTQGLPRIAPP